MAEHWLTHLPGGLKRAAKLRWATRGGFTVGDVPEFHPDAVAWFRQRIGEVRHYIEYGSGASTVLAARAGVRTISMEGDPRFAAAVRAALPHGAPVEILDAELGLTAEWSFPVFTRPTPARQRIWRDYARRPLTQAATEGWMPDLILVDGRFRRSCALHAAQAVIDAGQRATIFLDDYAPRAHYHSIERHLGKPQMVGLSALFRVDETAPLAHERVAESVLAEAARDVR